MNARHMNNVSQAAYDYAEAVRALESADECGMPSDFLRSLKASVQTLHGALLTEALAHFDNTYDGAPPPVVESPRFQNTSCSNCGRNFGPGDSGFSHCENHAHLRGVAA